jgi:hypothetical protein
MMQSALSASPPAACRSLARLDDHLFHIAGRKELALLDVDRLAGTPPRG